MFTEDLATRLVENCLMLTDFDYIEYLRACAALSMFWFVWAPPEASEPLINHIFPRRQTPRRRILAAALNVWAERTDPYGAVRAREAAREWASRKPDELIVCPFKSIAVDA